MNVVETITQQIFHLPPEAQDEVLQIDEQIQDRYSMDSNGYAERVNPLRQLADLATDVGVTDLAERHDFWPKVSKSVRRNYS